MRSVYERNIAQANEIQGRIVSGRDTVVPPPLWTDFARLCWPEKTAAHLATLGGKDERTAKRWLSGEYEPPMVVVLALFNKMFERRG
jgi:hypothetical protein